MAEAQQIEDRRIAPKGAVPKATWNRVRFGVFGALVILVLYSWRHRETPQTQRANTLNTPATPQGNQAQGQQAARNITEYIDRRVGKEFNRMFGRGDADEGSETNRWESSRSSGGRQLTPYQQLQQRIALDRMNRHYESLKASSVPASYQVAGGSFSNAGPQVPRGRATQEVQPVGLDTLADDLENLRKLTGAAMPQPQSRPRRVKAQEDEDSEPDQQPNSEEDSAPGKQYRLSAGYTIPCVLLVRINGTFPGPADCMVTEPVWSHSRKHLLIESGTKVLGRANPVSAFGQARLAVVYDRFEMPDGFRKRLPKFQGLDQAGQSGITGKVNNHYLKIFGYGIALGIMSAIAEGTSGNVFERGGWGRVQEGVGYGIEQATMRMMDKLWTLPSIQVDEGTRIGVYLTNDLFLPEYGQHALDPDF